MLGINGTGNRVKATRVLQNLTRDNQGREGHYTSRNAAPASGWKRHLDQRLPASLLADSVGSLARGVLGRFDLLPSLDRVPPLRIYGRESWAGNAVDYRHQSSCYDARRLCWEASRVAEQQCQEPERTGAPESIEGIDG